MSLTVESARASLPALCYEPRAPPPPRRYPPGEGSALRPRLPFRALTPMRSRDNMLAVAEGIEAMCGEAAC